MQQTLFLIPHEWFAGPLLIAWLVLGVVVMGVLRWRTGSWNEVWNFLPVYGIGVVVVHFVLPQLEVDGINPADPSGPWIKQGLAVRGYGVCLLLAIVAGVGLTLSRCRQVGISSDQILSLAFWMTICGILGARIFFVIQKSDEFFSRGHSLWQTIIDVVDMTKGGLVVYGSLIGGMLAAVVFFRVTKLSVLKTADLIAPGMVLGLAIGRIGCLMNGCCFGGLCEVNLPAIQFPAGSPAYMQQLRYGELLGMKTEEASKESLQSGFARVVLHVQPAGLADQLGIKVDDEISVRTPDSEQMKFMVDHAEDWPEETMPIVVVDSRRLGQLAVPMGALDKRSLKVHPTQIYSSINAAVLCLVLWFFWKFRRNDGEVFALMLILYSIGRFLLEMLRRDEAGLFGTSLTISQWVSIGALIFGFALMAYVKLAGNNAREAVEKTPVSAG